MTVSSDKKQFWQILVTALLGALFALHAWLLLELNGNVKDLTKTLNQYQVEVVKTYVTKEDFNNYIRRAN